MQLSIVYWSRTIYFPNVKEKDFLSIKGIIKTGGKESSLLFSGSGAVVLYSFQHTDWPAFLMGKAVTSSPHHFRLFLLSWVSHRQPELFVQGLFHHIPLLSLWLDQNVLIYLFIFFFFLFS